MKTPFFVCLFSFLALFGYSEKRFCMKTADLCQEESSSDRDAFKQRVQSQRIAYFTKKLVLTPAEAERFWPLYNTYQNERERLINETNRLTRTRRGGPNARPEFDVSNMSDAEARRLVANKARQIELDRKFHEDLTRMFSPQRVLAFYDAERSFQRELINARNRGGGEQRTEQRPEPRDRRERR